MRMTTNEQLKHKEQNNEIIRQNVKLHERIHALEGIIEDLQRDNIKYRIEKSKGLKKKPVRKKKSFKKKPIKKEPCKKKHIVENTNHIVHSKRSTKAVNYVLPSTKSKLRKGDPFTFGNET